MIAPPLDAAASPPHAILWRMLAPDSSRPRRFFWPAALVLLAIMAVTEALSVRMDSQIWDEAFELASGYTYLLTGQYRLSVEHPPLPRTLAALPLLALGATAPLTHPSWAQSNEVAFGGEFLYRNRVPADTMLWAARLVMIGFTLALGLAIALWTRRQFGATAALVALALVVFEPTILGPGRYVKGDVAVALFGFLAVTAWASYLESRKTSALLWTGLASGLAFTSKFSAVYLGPALVLLALIAWWRGGRAFPWLRTAAAGAVALGVTALTTIAVYAPHTLELFSRDSRHPLILGIQTLMGHNRAGHPGYLLGAISSHGWWYYFPVAFAVKEPAALLAGLAVAVALGALWLVRRRGTLAASLRAIPLAWFTLLVPIATYLPLALSGNIDCGIRHLLPIYPSLLILTAAAFALGLPRARTAASIALVVLVAVESLSVYPSYLAFFNVFAGGPKNGPNYLLDSNIDWGQDVRRLKAYLVRHRVGKPCTCYFGTAAFSYYGIDADEVPDSSGMAAPRNIDCLVAVSATPLFGLYVPPERFAWLRALEPTDRIGYSIYIYDLRKKRGP